jgi:Lon protease-like protein
MGQSRRIPLFPLNVVLLPRMPLPLHIFEERYRTMVRECLEAGTEFGVVHSHGSNIFSNGCTAGIERVIKEYDDGRMDILTIGQSRFSIGQIVDEKAYLEADISYFDDTCTEYHNDLDGLARKVVDTLADFATLTGRSLQRSILDKMDYNELSFLIGTAGVFSTDEKQNLLETQCAQERLYRALEWIQQNIDRHKQIEKVRSHLGDDCDISNLMN